MNITKVRESILVFLTHKVGMPYFKLVRKPLNFQYNLQQLSELAPDTVGFHLYKFLDSNHLDLLPYYEKHDIKHILLDYPATEKGEVCLQCFMLANGRCTLPVITAVLFGVITMPEYWQSFKEAFIKGYRHQSLQDIDWFGLLTQPLEATKKLYLQPK